MSSCPYSLHEFIWTWTRDVRRRPKAPRWSETADAPSTCLGSSEQQTQPYVEQRENRCCFSICEIECWTAVSFTSSVRKEVDIKVTVLFMCIASISVEVVGPSRDSKMNNEARLRPSSASHLLRATRSAASHKVSLYTHIIQSKTNNNRNNCNHHHAPPKTDNSEVPVRIICIPYTLPLIYLLTLT